MEAFRQQYPDSNVLIQETDMNEEERERFLTKFQTNPAETLIGFCVLGGIFFRRNRFERGPIDRQYDRRCRFAADES